jgi:release factor H-coupled RctB family protein
MSASSPRVRLIASPSSWIEGEAIRQLEATSSLPGMRWVVGMPDLHPGKGYPVGVAALADGFIYPHLVGADIGCGMSFFTSRTPVRKLAIARAVKRLRGLEEPWGEDPEPLLAEHRVIQRDHLDALGTIGGGNHFAELQAVEERVDEQASADLLGPDESVLLLVHSGSRGFGEQTMRAHTDRSGAAPIEAGSERAVAYLAGHDDAVRWGRANRLLIARRFAALLGLALEPLIDICHNAVVPFDGGWLHRKGAAPHDQGKVVIPGSRGSLSYVVEPTGDGAACGHSLAHGAGRKWSRTEARERMRDRFRSEALLRTPLGNPVICEDRTLLFEEAPEAYKRIDRVVADLVEGGACRVVATLRPLLTYKVRSGGVDGDRERG